MKTLLLNPPSFENFDGGAGARWPARREISSFWYPVWLAYPAGMIPASRLVDAPPHHLNPEQVIQIARDYDFLVLFTSKPGFDNDVRLVEMIKDINPNIKVSFVGPPVSVQPEESLRASKAIDFVVRKEFDFAVRDFAEGSKLGDIPGVSYWRNGGIIHNPDSKLLLDLDSLPFVTDVYKRDLDFTKYNIPFLHHPFVSFYTSRGCPARCCYCLWPQTFSGHRWRMRSAGNVAAEVRHAWDIFPGLKEIYFDDDTFAWGKRRTLEVCSKLKPLKTTWSCTCRTHADYETLKAMKEAGCRLTVTGFESGDPVVLKNMRKGATVEMGLEFMKNARKLGILVHGDFIVGLPGDTPETVERTMRYAEELDCETIQVSIAHAYPGTEFDSYLKENGFMTNDDMVDEMGHQMPNFEYPTMNRQAIMEAVEHFYGRYYFRPRIIYRIVKKAVFDKSERKRLFMEAREYLALRAKRLKFVKTPARSR